MNSFYSKEELNNIGFKSFGENVLISKKCSIYSAKDISIGNNVRIDDFCLLSGKIKIGNNVHISAYSALYGAGEIEIGNFCGISPRTIIFSASDDFSGEYMVKIMVPAELTNIRKEKVVLNDYVQLGTNTTVMPGVVFGQGAVTGACSLVLKNLEPWSINVGTPAKKIKERSKKILKLAKQVQNG